jgi:hypothetical protein
MMPQERAFGDDETSGKRPGGYSTARWSASNPAARYVKVRQTIGNSKHIGGRFKMADDKDKKKCKNPSCSCPATEGTKYCSASCQGTGDTIELDCDCGHDDCSGNF